MQKQDNYFFCKCWIIFLKGYNIDESLKNSVKIGKWRRLNIEVRIKSLNFDKLCTQIALNISKDLFHSRAQTSEKKLCDSYNG